MLNAHLRVYNAEFVNEGNGGARCPFFSRLIACLYLRSGQETVVDASSERRGKRYHKLEWN